MVNYPKRKEDVVAFNSQLEIIENVHSNNSRIRLNSSQTSSYTYGNNNNSNNNNSNNNQHHGHHNHHNHQYQSHHSSNSRYSNNNYSNHHLNNAQGYNNAYQGQGGGQHGKYGLGSNSASAIHQSQKYYQQLQQQPQQHQQFGGYGSQSQYQHSPSHAQFQQQNQQYQGSAQPQAQYLNKYDYQQYKQAEDYSSTIPSFYNNSSKQKQKSQPLQSQVQSQPAQSQFSSQLQFFNNNGSANNEGAGNNLSASSSLLSETNPSPAQPYDFKNLFMMMSSNNSTQSINSTNFNSFSSPLGKAGGIASGAGFLDNSNSPVLMQPQHTTTSVVGGGTSASNNSPPSMLLSTPVSAGSSKSATASGFLDSPSLMPTTSIPSNDTWGSSSNNNVSIQNNPTLHGTSIWGTTPSFSNSSTITTLPGTSTINSNNNSTGNFGSSSMW